MNKIPNCSICNWHYKIENPNSHNVIQERCMVQNDQLCCKVFATQECKVFFEVML